MSEMQVSESYPSGERPRDVMSGSAVPAGSETDREVRAGVSGQDPVPSGFPVPGQQLVHPGVRQLGDAGEDTPWCPLPIAHVRSIPPIRKRAL